jgi:hypothetical protein
MFNPMIRNKIQKTMKSLSALILLVLMGQGILAQTYYGPNYVHANSPTNCYGDYTLLDGTIVGTNSTDHLIFTHVWGITGGTHEEYMAQSHGLWWAGTEWSIFNEKQIDIDQNLAFNVLNAKANGSAFTHTVTLANTILNWSLIDNALLNNNPTAVFFISKSWDNGVYDTAHVGIWYDQSNAKWSVYNENGSTALKPNSTYNIFVPNAGTSYFKHVATSNYYITYLDNPLLNGNPDAKIFVVHDYTNSPSNYGYINRELGVWYDGSAWTIYNDDPSDTLFNGATFNVLVIRDNPVGITSNSPSDSKLTVSPNPAKDKIGVTMSSMDFKTLKELRLSSIDGEILLQKTYHGVTTEPIQLDISAFAQGFYILTAITGEGTHTTKVDIAR